MNFWNILGLAVCSAAICAIVRQISQPLSVYVSALSALVLTYFAVKYFQPVITLLRENTDSGYAGVIMKLTAIGVLTMIVSDICSDMGENTIAGRVELVGKGAAALTVLPVLENLISSVRDFLI